MTVKEVMDWMEEWAPLAYSEEFDNTGLLVGDKMSNVTGILVTLDTLESVVDEAMDEKCNLIISFHPIVFKGLKKITGSTYVERVVQKAIRNDIAIYAIHTALDNAWNGVNAMISEKLQLTDRQILIPQEGTIKKLVSYVPQKAVDILRNNLFDVGAGNIGNYDHCSFNIEGTGTFRGNEDSNPVIGKRGETRKEAEIQIGITFAKHLEAKVLKALFDSHPYEEVAFEITTLENSNQHIGMGMLGSLPEAMTENDFLRLLKDTFGTGVIRHSQLMGKTIKKVAVLGGSGSFALSAAKAAGADAFVTSDVKYHDFFAAENQLLLTDIGHYESEQYTKELIVAYLSKKISNFAPALSVGKVVLSKLNTNPISYY
jgi:dinuclear metal center YbgI/SA1388 family protein